jgi:hypothetical protein
MSSTPPNDTPWPAMTPTPRPYNLTEIQFIRDEVRFQHTLIGMRVSWFVGAQAFLVTPFAICISNQQSISHTYPLAFIGIPFLGITLSLLIVQGIQQAIRRIEEQHIRIQAYETDHLLGPPDPVAHRKSLEFAMWVPWVFATFWAIIVLIGIALFVLKHLSQ